MLVAGCGPSGSEGPEDYLLRVGNRKVTSRDFLQALELAKTAYPDGPDPGSPALQDARRHLLDELTTELIILNRAEEVGITVSEAELEAAVSAIRADYPPGAFEQTLAEAAVSLEPWKQRMRSRLLLDKLVQVELTERITVNPEEVVDYYNQHYRGKAGDADSDDRFRRLQETIAADVRRKKLEDAFADWVEGLKARYPVHVNAQQWERLDRRPLAASTPPVSE
jgi:hypothetical protein